MSYGRSGSTLLQGVLNSFDGYCIRGENGCVLLPIFRAYKILRDAKNKHVGKPTPVTSAWYGIENTDPESLAAELTASFIKYVIRPDDKASVIGFKEIRYIASQFSDGEFADFMSFLDKQFPDSCFIFNSRNLSNVASSKWWADKPNAHSRLVETEELMKNTMREYFQKSFWIRYEDYTTNPESLQSLPNFLGEEFNLAKVKHVLEARHSY
nr:sulfotransferase [Candidatus Seongchinamella marina]